MQYSTGNHCVGLLSLAYYDKICFLRIQDMQQSSGLFAISESDRPVNHITGYYNIQGG